MNRISKTLKEKDNILSIYFTAGFPELNSTIEIIKNLVSAGVDMIEINTAAYAEGETTALERIKKAAVLSRELGLEVAAGHGLTHHNLDILVKKIFKNS